MKKHTIAQFNKEFPNEKACLNYLFERRYGSDYPCPKCLKEGKWYRVEGRKCYSCEWCRYQIHPVAGTIFHKSETLLKSWFYAIYLFGTSKNGVSAKELQRHLGVTYKTAWRIAKQIRSLMKQGNDLLDGTVEADETYIGGKAHGKGRGAMAGGKIPVSGMVERKGRVRAVVVKNVKTSTLMSIIRQNIRIGANLMSDEHYAYLVAGKEGYRHKSVKHSKREYVRGNVHTNTIEGFWSQLKRSIHGTYVSVSPKHLQAYVDEFVYRYNRRASEVSIFHRLLLRVVGRAA